MPEQERGALHVVTAGDCIHSLAEAAGIAWKEIWDHPRNEELRRERSQPNQLLPGDSVFVPARARKDTEAPSDQRHRFRQESAQVEIRVEVCEFGRARKGECYHVEGPGGERYEGVSKKTDDKGLAVVRVPARLREAVLVVGDSGDRYQLLIGHMDPPETPSGAHARLQNMGYDCGGVDHPWDERSEQAMREFHRDTQTPQNGHIDYQRLRDLYGS